MSSKQIQIGLCAVAVLVAACLLADCCFGTTRYFEASVNAHHYKPAWTETHINTDSDGNTHFSTTRHPEEFHLICGELAGARTFDVNTTSAIYHSKTNGQYVTVKTRQGRWTGAQWLPQIAD